MTQCRSLTDIHLMGKQYEGIKGFDPVRYRRFVAGEHVDSKGRNTKKYAVSLGYTATSIFVQQFKNLLM